MHNIAGEPASQPVLLECAQEMLRWRMRHTDHRVTHLALGAGGATPTVPTLHEALAAARLYAGRVRFALQLLHPLC